MPTLLQPVEYPMGQLFRFLKRYWKHFSATCVASIFNKIFDLMPPLLVGWLVAALTLKPPHWMHYLVDTSNAWSMAVLIAVLAVIIFAAESITQWMTDYGFMTLAQRTQHDLRMACYRRIQTREIAFFEQHRLGDTMAMLNDDINQLERFLNTGFNDLLQLATLIVFASWVLFSTSWQLAIIGLLPVPIIIACSLWFQHSISPRYKKVRECVGDLSTRLENNLSGITVIKSFTAEQFEAERVNQASQHYRQANHEAIKLTAVFVPLIRMAVALGFGGTLLLGSYWILNGSDFISLASLVTFSMLIQRILWPLTRLGQALDDFERAKASAARTFSLLTTLPTIREPKTPEPLSRAKGDVSFEQVQFSYQATTPVLNGLDFKIAAGETVGIAGHTGCGKSTLIKLLLRLYDVNQGRISIDGIDIKSLSLADLRRQIALVSQDVYLFQGSIFDNIAYGLDQVNQQHVIAAAKTAHLHEFIQSLPGGYNTLVGERGIKLSGGQRQRLSIARAVLKDAPIIILDEATSSVDTETEKEIQRNLEKLTQGKTALIIAHRLSTIRNADKILVLRDGKVIEQGHHDTLVKSQGSYADLWAVQCGMAQ